MLGAIAFTYGLMTSFVLTSASRNRKLRRPNPAMLVHAGYVCLGISIGLAVLMTMLALWILIA